MCFIISYMSDGATDEDKTRLISLPDAAKIYGFHPRYLAELVRKGRLEAQKLGGVWITTPANVEEYIRSRKKRGVYRDDIQVDD